MKLSIADSIDINVPLVLDLDDVLITTDLLYESAVAFVQANPLNAFKILKALTAGRAKLKQVIVIGSNFDINMIPANGSVVELAETEHAKGREIVLATASDAGLATQFMKRFPFISTVLSSDGIVNLKGQVKARALAERFPEGFIYAGDSWADLHVWKMAEHSVVVSRYKRVQKRAQLIRDPILQIARPPLGRALLRSLRPHQWSKNTLAFLPLFLAGEVLNFSKFASVSVAFIALCLAASSTYLINDIMDLKGDRAHWSKRSRPLASGDLPLSIGLFVSCGGILLASLLPLFAGLATVASVILYMISSVIYSSYLKRVPIVDCLTLGSLFTLRILVGGAAADITISIWLLSFSMFIFTGLAFAKRYTEISRAISKDQNIDARRGYERPDLQFVLIMGVALSISSIVLMILYVVESAYTRTFQGYYQFILVFPAALMLWLSRIWLLNVRGKLNDDPVAFALRDRVSWLLCLAMAVAFALAMYPR